MQVDDAQETDVVVPVYNLIEHSDNYSNTFRSLWQYFRDESNATLADSESFKSKVKITGKTANDDNTKKIEIAVPLKYLSNFWGTLEMPQINCEINLNLTCSTTCVVTNSTGVGTFGKTDTKTYVPVVTLSTQDTNWNRVL